MRARSILLLCTAAAAIARPASADAPRSRIEGELARGTQQFQDLEYRSAIQILRPVRLDPDATRAQKLQALELIGISHLILGDKARATEAFQDLLTIDAGYQLRHDDGSPKIRAFYENVKAGFLPGFAAGMEAGMDHSAPPAAVAGRPAEIEAVVRVGVERVADIVLRWRRSGVLDYIAAPMRRRPGDRTRWRARFTPPPSRAGYPVDYYVEARNAAGGAIGRIGGPETPLALTVSPGEPDAEPGAWYTHWYVIAGGAALVAVGATAFALGAGDSDVADGTLGRVTLSP